MSDERLEALGLPRREFLKRAAIGAGIFAAPVIVSFGLGGTAEAAACFPNQGFANQQATTMGQLIVSVWMREQQDLVEPEFASHLRTKLLDAEGRLLDGDPRRSCMRLDELQRDLQRQSGRKI